uniref:Ribosomal protein S17e n=1 Tax=Amorphochlora amoebiformis TaxID=1561963 RepID=A0A0H5BR15_9EUKA|nr:ribosomal protein S17e [Amorphochlora amoebiformis]|mmetsp:Transcript_14343/g.22765  ORF Transcript_14343/g.22765 Transcript_14343/m.22765 type:complete len:107 (+) Transcript_14343:291-611(+)
MGHIKPKNVKINAKYLFKKQYTNIELNFKLNKYIVEYFLKIQSKKQRNKMAGYLTKYKTQKIYKKSQIIESPKNNLHESIKVVFNSLKYEKEACYFHRSFYDCINI